MRLLIMLLLSFASSASCAHQLSTAYLNASVNNTGVVAGQWQVRFYDLEQAIGLDANGDGKLLWGELQSRTASVNQYLSNHLRLARGNVPCPLLIETSWQITEHFNEGYLVLPVRAQCALTGALTLHYSAFLKEDNEHKLLITINSSSSDAGEKNYSNSRVISADQPSITISNENGSLWFTLKEFTAQGVVHIWKGLDHILFLLSLLLTCVLIRRKNVWVAKKSIGAILVTTTWIVTAFTLAHSITLTATALGWINLSSHWVEVGIALSVALAALNNIFPIVIRLGWLTFAFGLLHGMGFAGVLGELGVPADQKVPTVLAFNLGVEIGQMVIVVAVLPLLILVRNNLWYSRYSLIGASLVIILVALQWVAERI